MPTYRITDPDSGRTVSVTGETPPSQQDIDQIFKALPQQQVQQQQSPQHPVMNFLRSVGLGAIPDILGTAQFAANEAKEGVNPLNPGNATPQQLRQAAQGNAFLTPQQLQQTGGVKQAGQDLAGAASYAVPFGEGANVVTRALLPGAISGGLQAASQNNGNIAAGAAAGATGAGLLHGAGQLVAPLFNKAGQAADNLGNKLIQSQYLVKPSSKIANDIKGTISTLSKYGVTNPEQMTQIASVVTGPDGIVNAIKNRAIAQADPVDTGGILDVAKKAINQSSLLRGTKTGQNFQNIIKNGIYSAAQGGPEGGDPTKIFKFVQDLEGQAADIGGFGANKTEQQLASAYRTVATDLKDRLFSGTDATGAVTRNGADAQTFILSPQQYQQLHQISPQLANDVAGAQTIKQLRSIEAPFVRASKLATESEDRQSIKPFDWGDLGIVGLGGLHPATLAFLGLKKYANSNMGKRQIGAGLMGAGNAMKAATPANSGLQALMDYLGAKAGATAANP